MSGVSKIKYRGKEIIYLDFSGLDEGQIIEIILTAGDIILSERKKVRILVLGNLNGFRAMPEVEKVLLEFGRKTRHLVQKAAAVGFMGENEVFLMGLNKMLGNMIKTVDNKGDGKEYLLGD